MRLSSILSVFRGSGQASFCLRAVVFLLFLGSVSISRPFRRSVESPILSFDAWVTHESLGILGIDTKLLGREVHSSAFAITVIPECTGIFVFVILVSMTLAFPAGWQMKAKGLLVGTALIFCLNQVRLVSLFLIGSHFRSIFEDVHLFVWQPFFILAVVAYWSAWAHRACLGPKPSAA